MVAHPTIALASLALVGVAAPVVVAAGEADPPRAVASRHLRGDAADAGGEGTHVLAAEAEPALPDFLVEASASRSRSVGPPNGGRLERGVSLPESGPGWVRISRDRHWGTAETVALIEYAGARLEAAFPGTQPMLVGDLSQEGGGRIRPHRSHQSGRDADIAFLERGGATRRHFKGDLRSEDIDVAKTWFVIESLLTTGQVRFVFINRALLPAFRRHAAEAGWPERELDELFLMPDEVGHRGLIRHASGHTYHFHVRFVCAEGDEGCEDV